jgi:hypothetical protein
MLDIDSEVNDFDGKVDNFHGGISSRNCFRETWGLATMTFLRWLRIPVNIN